MDTSPEKRVELHCHTKMSDMDGVSDVKDIVQRLSMGQPAIAMTDHEAAVRSPTTAVSRRFPEAPIIASAQRRRSIPLR